MRVLRPASEDDMTAVFLAAGATPERYGPQIRGILARLRQPRGIAEQPDTRDEAANAAAGRCSPPTAATRRATCSPACPPPPPRITPPWPRPTRPTPLSSRTATRPMS